MKYSNGDLMNEGWASMETLLNKEMPTSNKKDYNYWLIGLFVVFAFVVGLVTGSQIPTKTATAELIKEEVINLKPAKDISSILAPQSETNKSTLSATTQSSTSSALINKVSFNSDPSAQENTSNPISLVNHSKTNNRETVVSKMNQSPNPMVIETESSKIDPSIAFANVANASLNNVSLIGMIPFKKMVSNGLSASYLPRNSSKAKQKTNWVLGLGLSTGINVDRNTKVLSLNTDWMYRIGKQNAIGVQFLYSAEDEFGFFNSNENPAPPASVRPDPKEEGTGRNPIRNLTPNSRQYRFATGLVIQQEVGYRFYSNFAFGIDMLQNSYSEDVQLKSLTNVSDIQYHFGGYTSVAIGYRLSNLVNLEISGTKSMLIQDAGIYKTGNSDHIVGGLKISF